MYIFCTLSLYHDCRQGCEGIEVGKRTVKDGKCIIEKIRLVLPHLNEVQRHIYLALEALYMDWGGKIILEKEFRVSHNMINSGINVSHTVIGNALKLHGFSLQVNRKTFQGKGYEDRDSQFEFINR